MKPTITYKNTSLQINNVHMEGGLKFAGLKISEYPNFANIEEFHTQFAEKVKLACASEPYVEIGYSGTYKGGKFFDYIFGCQIYTEQTVPDGLTVFDTGLTDFIEIQFEAGSAHDLVGDENGPGSAMDQAREFFMTRWLPANKDKVALADEANGIFAFNKDGIQYLTGMIEVYRFDIANEHRMSFYVPLSVPDEGKN